MKDSFFSKTSKEAILKNQSSSPGNPTKLVLTFCLFIFFSLIFASIICVFSVLSSHAYSQMLIHNPKNATHLVCIFTSDPDFCYDAVYVSSPPPDGTNPTHIFYISLLSSLGYLSDLVDLPKSTISGLDSETRFVLRKCEFAFVFAQSQLNESVARLHMEKSEYGKLLGVDKLVWDLQSLISQANGQLALINNNANVQGPDVTIIEQKRKRVDDDSTKLDHNQTPMELGYKIFGLTVISLHGHALGVR
nr:uncharacterized protein LOC109162687 [Ipomoea trifida]